MIIAEFCQNHQGSMEIVEEMIRKAEKAGVWACKIQSFFADDLSHKWLHDYDRIRDLELSWEKQERFVKLCKNAGMVPMTTVYTEKYWKELQECGFKWIKIGSPNMNDMTARFMKTLGFNVLVSTGGWDLKEIKLFHPLDGVLHCVSKYPHAPSEANIHRMIQLKEKFNKSACGFSDHTDPLHEQWYLPSYLAMFLGATFIEKHYTILARSVTKDGPVSVDYKQLKELVYFEKLPKEEKEMRLAEENGLISVYANRKQNDKELVRKYATRWNKSVYQG